VKLLLQNGANINDKVRKTINMKEEGREMNRAREREREREVLFSFPLFLFVLMMVFLSIFDFHCFFCSCLIE
jgi:hypothetical protein